MIAPDSEDVLCLLTQGNRTQSLTILVCLDIRLGLKTGTLLRLGTEAIVLTI